MQRKTLKTIFGWNVPYRECLEKAGIPSLWQRRETLFRNFTYKEYASEWYANRWFEKQRPVTYGLRKTDEVVQKFAGRDRLRNAPCYKMREMINKDRRNE